MAHNNNLPSASFIENKGADTTTSTHKKLRALFAASVLALSSSAFAAGQPPMIQGNDSVNVSPHQDLIDGYTSLMISTQPNVDTDAVRKNVNKKIDQLTAQEPFFLRAALESSTLSNAEKVNMFTMIRSDSDSGERYPRDYHVNLIRLTDKFRNKN